MESVIYLFMYLIIYVLVFKMTPFHILQFCVHPYIVLECYVSAYRRVVV
jgi:hypothetical protein